MEGYRRKLGGWFCIYALRRYNWSMHGSGKGIPDSLQPYFQEYNLEDLSTRRHANLIIQRTLEFGTWEEIRWLFRLYSKRRIQRFLREHGVRWLKPVTFNYWRKLLELRRWQTALFGEGDVWNH